MSSLNVRVTSSHPGAGESPARASANPGAWTSPASEQLDVLQPGPGAAPEAGAPEPSSPLRPALRSPQTAPVRLASTEFEALSEWLSWPSAPVTPPPPTAAQGVRDRLLTQFYSTDHLAALGQALGEEQQRFAQAEGPRSWRPTPKTALLLQWLSGQSGERARAGATALTALPEAFEATMAPYRRAWNDTPLRPVDLLGDQWTRGQIPKDTTLMARFAPAPARRAMPAIPAGRPSAPQRALIQALPWLLVHGAPTDLHGFVDMLLVGSLTPRGLGPSGANTGPLDTHRDNSRASARGGPFYTVLDPGVGTQNPANLAETAHIAYIVPTRVDMVKIQAALALAERLEQISYTQRIQRLNKLVCYDDLLGSTPRGLAAEVRRLAADADARAAEAQAQATAEARLTTLTVDPAGRRWYHMARLTARLTAPTRRLPIDALPPRCS